MVFEMGLLSVLHRCTILVATLVSFSALTQKRSSFLMSSGSSDRRISRSKGRSRLSTLCSWRLSRDKGSAMAIVGPDLYSVVTVLVRSDVSCSFHVDNLPLLLSDVLLIPGR